MAHTQLLRLNCWLDIREEKGGGERAMGERWICMERHSCTHTHTIIKAVIVGIVFSITKPTGCTIM